MTLAICTEAQRPEEIKHRQREFVRHGLSKQVALEGEHATGLDSRVTRSTRGSPVRNVIAALKRVRPAGGNDLAFDGEKAKRILWIKEQADRAGPLPRRAALFA